MHHFSTFTLSGLLLLSFVPLSWAQSNSSLPSSSTSPLSSLNSTISGSLTSSAQFPSLSGYSPCVTNCLQVGIAGVDCSSVTEVNCYCINPLFPQGVFDCIKSNCPAELMTEEALAQQFCKLASSSPTLTFPSATFSINSSSSGPTAISSPAQSTPSPTATASSATARLNSGTLLFSGFLASLVYPFCIYLV